MTTHLECERESQSCVIGATRETLLLRHQAYETLVAEALREEDEDERAERHELTQLAQGLVRQALLAGDAL
ncbi:MAG TPA: hypothetical protein VKQ36_04175 [Ktedonobacterales bacterium]|nr:hypothetical protein [Ktedonobacterales bacterium]